ncbi:MAG: MarR family winged helix-turn-helix transcriptional regulator, partial [Pseudomonadota bacterium]|nr:MarR family winged helix-turn-helix transcriptional regulator [Pseudomonadota bacterium]
MRKVTRAVTQLYDEMLRPAGLRGTQFSLLVVVRMAGPVDVTHLAELTVMDRTTLTRNLELLQKQG